MKKLLIAVLAAAAVCAGVLTGCGAEPETTEIDMKTPSVSTTSSEAASQKPEETSQPEETASQAPAGDFEGYFAQNPLDAGLNLQLANLNSTSEMVSAVNTFAGLWRDEVSHAYELLMKDAEGVARGQLEDAQTAWNSNHAADAEAAANAVPAGSGSAARLEQAMAVKEFYREKAKELYQQVYDKDPNYTYVYAPY